MAISVTLNGVTRDLPEIGDSQWGQTVTDYLVAVASSTLQPTGGTFTLTSEVDFGATHGLRSTYFRSRSTAANAGILRLANTETVAWRNAANDGNKALSVNASDQLIYDSNPVLTLALGAANTALKMNAGGTAYEWGDLADANISGSAAIAYSKLALTGSIVNADVSGSAAIAYSKLALADSIVNADVSTTAAIAVSKLAALTASRAVQTSASGVLEPSAVTATELGYLSGVTSSIQTQLNAKEPAIPTGTAGEYLRGDKTYGEFAPDVAATAAVTANTAKVSASGSINTHSDVDTTTSAPSNGDVLTWDGSNWVPDVGGAGSGEVNFNNNPNGVADVTDYVASSTGVTVARTTTTADLPRFPNQSTGIKLTFATGTNDYVRLRFRVPPADRSKKLKIEWAQLTASYVTATSEVKLFNYSDNFISDEAEVSLHGNASIPAQTGVYYNEFDADSREYYELRIVNAGATAGTITLNDFVIGPGKLHSGAVVTKWEAFTPGALSGWTASATSGYWRRVGDSIEIMASATADTVSGTLQWDFVPSGLTVGTLPGAGRIPVGSWTLNRGSVIYSGTLGVLTGSGLARFYTSTDSLVSATVPASFASGDVITVNAAYPIAEWAGSGVLNVITQDNLSEWIDWTPTGSWTANTSYFGKYRKVGTDLELDVRLSLAGTPTTASLTVNLPSGFTIDTEAMGGSNSLQPLGLASVNDGSPLAAYNGQVQYNSTTSVAVKYADADSKLLAVTQAAPFTFGSTDGVSFKIKVPVVEFRGSQSSLVGFAGATATQMGLYKAGQAPGTNTNDSATAGNVGEYVESKNAAAGTYGTASNTTGNITSITLTPGDWDVSFVFLANGGACTFSAVWIGTATASTTGRELGSNHSVVDGSGSEKTNTIASWRVSISSTTTYYLNSYLTYSSAPNHSYRLSARRAR